MIWNGENLLFLKGFETYNTEYINDFPISYNDREYNNDILHHSWEFAGINHSYTDTIKSNGEYSKIIYSVGSEQQVLIARYPQRKSLRCIILPKITDLDGDNKYDLVVCVRAYDMDNAFSYLLFLSSEADEGKLLKHVATKTIYYKQDKFVTDN